MRSQSHHPPTGTSKPLVLFRSWLLPVLQRPSPSQVFQKRHRVERQSARLHQQKQQKNVLPLVAREKKLRNGVRGPGGGGMWEERQAGGDAVRNMTRASFLLGKKIWSF